MSRDDIHSSRITFELLDMALADTASELFGLWAVVPQLSDEISASVAASAGAVDSPVWRANYTEDPGSAEANLAMGEARLNVSKKVLGKVPERLNRLMERQPAALDFGVSLPEEISAKPEAELLALLQEIQKSGEPVSYGMGEKFLFGWEQESQQFMTVLDRVCRFAACYGRVETRMQEQLLAQTTISWTGDINTAWKAGLTPEQVRLHQRTLALALESRDTLLRTVLMATQLAVKLSVLLSTPGGVILALPAVWRFIHQVLAESGEHNK
jgi:hypothetical protein